MSNLFSNNRLRELLPFDQLFDSHSHIYQLPEPYDRYIEEAEANQVMMIVDAAVDLETSILTATNQQKFPAKIVGAVGIHPEVLIPGNELFNPAITEDSLQSYLEKLEVIISDYSPKMLGECGLDYYWLNRNEELSPEQVNTSKYLQKQLLVEQLKLAKKFNLPVTLHCRDAEADCLKITSEYSGNLELIYHSFTGGLKAAEVIREMGFMIGVNGIITYKSAENIRTMLKQLLQNVHLDTPQDLYEAGFLLETDAPLLIPSNVKVRPNNNSPKELIYIWEKIKSI